MNAGQLDTEQQGKELEVLADEMDLGRVENTRARRRRTTVAGLGLGIENAGQAQGLAKAHWGQGEYLSDFDVSRLPC